MLCILSVMLVIITVSGAGNRLYNDICATVSKSSVSPRVAKVECHYDSVIFDPKSQNGALINNETGSWMGEIFACQCSCSLPNPPQNGQILTNGRVQHGKNLEYKCKRGEINNKIICFDGLLMMIPEFLEDYNIRVAFRQKSLPELFLNNFQDAIFQLSVNKMSNWSVHESEVSNNLKYTDIFDEKDTALKYYLFNGEGFKLGTIDLKIHLKLECGPVYDWSVVIAICASLAFMGIISAICISLMSCCPEKFDRCARTPPTSNLDPGSDLDDISYDLTDNVVAENDRNVIELTENENRLGQA